MSRACSSGMGPTARHLRCSFLICARCWPHSDSSASASACWQISTLRAMFCCSSCGVCAGFWALGALGLGSRSRILSQAWQKRSHNSRAAGRGTGPVLFHSAWIRRTSSPGVSFSVVTSEAPSPRALAASALRSCWAISSAESEVEISGPARASTRWQSRSFFLRLREGAKSVPSKASGMAVMICSRALTCWAQMASALARGTGPIWFHWTRICSTCSTSGGPSGCSCCSTSEAICCSC